MAKREPVPFALKNGNNLSIRTVRPSDAETYLEFRKKVGEESDYTLQYPGMPLPSLEETGKQLKASEEDETSLNLGVFDGPRLIADLRFVVMQPVHPWVRHTGFFGMMVLKEFGSQGVARRLLEIQDTHAKICGVNRIEAFVRTKNDRAIQLYLRSGFRIEGTRKHAALIHEKFEDEYYIAKIMDDPFLSWRPPTLKTKRMILRAIDLNDAASIYKYAQNPNVSKLTLWDAHKSVGDSRNYIQDYVFHHYSKGVPESFGVVLKDNPEALVGTVGCHWASQPHKTMELSCALAEEHWGQGLMIEASQAVMDFCFMEFEVKRIQARCRADNLQSRKAMEKAGMTFEGTLRASLFLRGQHWDMHHFSRIG